MALSFYYLICGVQRMFGVTEYLTQETFVRVTHTYEGDKVFISLDIRGQHVVKKLLVHATE